MKTNTLYCLLVIFLWIVLCLVSFCFAKSVGTIGQVYLIEEMDFLEFIKSRASLMEKDGSLFNLQKDMQKHAKSYRDRPTPVVGITQAMETKNWLVDPSIVLDHDIFAPDGKLIVRLGTRINPLDYVSLSKTLIFYDADDKKEVEWVIELHKKLNNKDKLILVKGSSISEEKRFSQKVYFDQGGCLVKRFNIKHVPAVVTQEGSSLRIREVKP